MRAPRGALGVAAAGQPTQVTSPALPSDASFRPLFSDADDPVLFYHPSERPFGYFSQWYAEPDGRFSLNGTTFFCAEQAMMAAKAGCSGDVPSKQAILAEQ